MVEAGFSESQVLEFSKYLFCFVRSDRVRIQTSDQNLHGEGGTLFEAGFSEPQVLDFSKYLVLISRSKIAIDKNEMIVREILFVLCQNHCTAKSENIDLEEGG